MKERCYVTTDKRYGDYGGRGIRVCERWLNSFEKFFADMGERPSQRHTIDRKNNNGNYEPGNCRWATRAEQNRNQRRNVIVEHDGKRLCVAEWAELAGISADVLRNRLNRGWSIEEAMVKGKCTRYSNHKPIGA